jgi:hypothetical protein
MQLATTRFAYDPWGFMKYRGGGIMNLKFVGLIILLGSSVYASTIDLHYRPTKAIHKISLRNPAKSKELTTAQKGQQKNLQRRIVWLETLNKYVHHKKGGLKVFPYEKKIKFLKKRLKELNSLEK